ncbi:MAG TPA: dynamin family protein [Nostocaceae cyanobacterium]|nr:dynamin family protein [Nostocaceae cyanobacterium]
MDSQTLKPNVQDLQTDVIDLLEQISLLMNRASTALSSDVASERYGKFQQEIADSARNVQELELVMSVVAPMKAGKSTIINAIVGQGILPSRNAAMTTLPTEIIFNSELTEPILTVSTKILSVFQETILALKEKTETLGIEQMQEKIAQYPHLMELLKEIQDTIGLLTPKKASGCEEIIKVLTVLNDIVRLCSILDPSNDPLSRIMDVPRIETPFWRSQKTGQKEKLGNLVIVDTPGPNEAGENLRLATVVADQLKKSSMVLIVLDFTQLNNKAAEDVKKEIQPVIELLGKDNLYVLVNKVDQRRKGDMTTEQVEKFVAADLEISDSSNTDRVFEVSAIRAFSAAKFMLELQQNPSIDIAEMQTVEVLAQEALGARWEQKLAKATVKDLQEEAQYLWEDSGFAPFLEKAINALLESAAPRTMKSALNLGRNRLFALRDDIQLRSSAISQDAEKLQYEVSALEADLKRLELCRSRIREVENIRSQLQNNLNEILTDLKKEALVSIEDYFIEEDYARADLMTKMDIKGREIFLTKLGDFEIFPSWISQRIRSKLEYKTKGAVEFTSELEAEEFANQAIFWAKQRSESLLSSVRNKTGKEIEQARLGLINFLDKETKPIIERARTRLNEAFNIDLSLPQPNLQSDNLDVAKPRVKNQTRYIDQGYETVPEKKRVWWHWLWIVPVDVPTQKKKPDKKEDYYIVSLQELVTQINQSIDMNVEVINQGLSKYLDEDFQERINTFFESLDGYLRNYRDSLRQAQNDQKLSLEQKEKLVNELYAIVPDANEKINKASTCLERTQQLIREK